MFGEIEDKLMFVFRVQYQDVAVGHLPPIPYVLLCCILEPRKGSPGSDLGIVSVIPDPIDAQNLDVEVGLCEVDFRENGLEVPELDTAVTSACRTEIVTGNLEKIIPRGNR